MKNDKVIADIITGKEYSTAGFARARKNLYIEDLMNYQSDKYQLTVDFDGNPILLKKEKQKGRPKGSKNKKMPKSISQINFSFKYQTSQGIRSEKGSLKMKNTRAGRRLINDAIQKYVNGWQSRNEINGSEFIDIVDNSIKYTKMILPYTKDLKKVKMFGLNVTYSNDKRFEYKQQDLNENCVIDYLTSVYSQSKNKYIQKYTKEFILEKVGVTAEELKNNGFSDDMVHTWFSYARQPYYCFDIKNTLISSYYPEKPDHHLASVMALKINGHFQPVTNKQVRLSLLNTLNNNGFKSIKKGTEKETEDKEKEKVSFKYDDFKMCFDTFANKNVYITDREDLNELHEKIISEFGVCGVIKGHKNKMNYLYFAEHNINIYANPEYETCSKVAKVFGYKYHNQSLSQLMRQYAEETLGDSFLHSELNNDMSGKIKASPWKMLAPNYRNKIKFDDDVVCSDLSKAYPSAMVNNVWDWCVYTKYDNIENYNNQPLKTGFYYVKTDNKLPFQGWGWYHASMVKFGLDENIINVDDIKLQYLPSKTMSADTFKKLFNSIWETKLPESVKKLCMNSYIGTLYKDSILKSEKLIFTTEFNEACYYYYKYAGSCIENLNNGFLVHYENLVPLEKIDSFLYLQMMANHRVNVYKLMKEMMNEDSQLVAIKCDCVSVRDGKLIEKEGVFGGVKKSEFPKIKNEIQLYSNLRTNETVKKYFVKDVVNKKGKDWVEMITRNKFNKSFMIQARGGCGKSYFLRELMDRLDKENIKFEALAFTHQARKNLKHNGVIVGQTLKKFFMNDLFLQRCKVKNIKVIILDEISMIPGYFWKKIDELKKIGIAIIGAGHFEQLPPVDGEYEYDYYESDLLKSIFDYREYTFTEYHRGNKELDDLLNNFLNSNKINIKKFGNKQCSINLCYTNNKRKEINKLYMSKNKGSKLKGAGNEYSQDMIIYKGLPIISYKNWKGSFLTSSGDKIKIFNNEWFEVVEDKKEHIVIRNDEDVIEIPRTIFAGLFVPRYAITIHKSQGITIEEDFTIHELDKLDKKLLYVALSRATEISKINFSL